MDVDIKLNEIAISQIWDIIIYPALVFIARVIFLHYNDIKALKDKIEENRQEIEKLKSKPMNNNDESKRHYKILTRRVIK